MGKRRRRPKVAILGILIGLGANLLTANATLSLLTLPVGSRIRPMGEGVTLLIGACVGVLGSALSFVAIRHEGTRWSGVAGIVVGLSPLPLGMILMECVIRLRQLVILP